MARSYYQGIYKPKNPVKYRGDHTRVCYRSSWELKAFIYFDNHPDILEWSSEEIVVPYVSPLDGRWHRYFVDIFVKKKNLSDGKIECCLIEIKPRAQTIQPQPSKKITKRYITEVQTWGVNDAKWRAATEYCKDRNWKFIIMDEYDLGIAKPRINRK